MGFVNYAPERVAVFGPDPNNPAAGIVHDAWLRLNGFLVAVVGGGNTDPSSHYHGDLGRPLQDFTGAAAAIGTGSLYRTSPTIAQDGNTVIEDPARAMLAARLRRGVSI
jgi:hypothetical protein